MATVKGVIEFEYDIPDEPKDRFHLYETVDLQECVEIDARNDPISLAASGVKITRYELKPASGAE